MINSAQANLKSPSSPEEWLVEIQNWVIVDRIDQASNRLMDFVRDCCNDEADMLDEVMLIKRKYNRLQKKSKDGEIRYEDEEISLHKLAKTILRTAREVEEYATQITN